ncbi:MAG: saccharopine dehydrogenase NADP-binding domain-containing protein [Anderseniella sp.]|jgi:saccharopine dehydrogenase-like NADP-dependent oxidoreductase|nr:saccharopine dehydrogenase NADP-binding domain-containing protein [Anderseniella sp.]
MKVLLLGGTGGFGAQAAAYLAGDNLITEVALASRRIEVAQQAAVRIGDKATAVCVDIKDVARLSSVASDYDIIVNAAGPTSDVQLPAIQGAIEAGVHYCDVAAIGKYAERAFQLDSQARAKGVTAVIATGWVAMNNLMAVHASRMLEDTAEISVSWLFDYTPGNYFSPVQSLARTRERGRVETSWDLIETAGEPVMTYRKGSWIRLDPLKNPVEVVHPSGSMITGYLTDSPSTFSLPYYLPGVKTVTCLLGMVPPQLMELFIQKSQRIARGETDWSGAALDFFETAVADKGRWLVAPASYPTGWWMWAVAEGQKEGRKARYLCWPSMILDWTNIPLIIVALRILRGEVSRRGVLPTEACFELSSFLDEVTTYVPEEHLGKPLLNERFDWLE